MGVYERIAERAQGLYEEAVSVRRRLHRWPEAGFKEYKTSAFVAEYLKGLVLDSIRTGVAGTGVVAELKGALPGPTLAIRADMDGLPITEKTGVEYKSEHEGWMHGCGHDAHTAGLLLTAKLLSGLRSELAGTVRFLFQPAEEGPGGAEPMVKEGAMDGVDMVIGGHVWGDHKPGQVALLEGSMFAAPDEFRVKIQGVGGHAAAPHTAVDTIPILAAILNALQTIVSRKVEPGVPCVVTVGTVRAGYQFNVIADVCELTGTVRTYDPKLQDMVRKSIKDICRDSLLDGGQGGGRIHRPLSVPCERPRRDWEDEAAGGAHAREGQCHRGEADHGRGGLRLLPRQGAWHFHVHRLGEQGRMLLERRPPSEVQHRREGASLMKLYAAALLAGREEGVSCPRILSGPTASRRPRP